MTAATTAGRVPSGLPRRYVAGLPAPRRCLVMGVVNVTPDSFSDGGSFLEPDQAIAHGRALAAAGADLIDVGGESTRPGADRPSYAEELRRVLPVVTELSRGGVPVSIDTMRAAVAERALAAGVTMVNDVSGGRADPAMLPLVASAGCPYVCMHWRGASRHMQQLAHYGDVVADVAGELRRQLDAAVAAGVAADRLIADPGLGYAKTAAHNWTLLGRLDRLHELGYPLLVAASRKAFLGRLLAAPDGTLRPTAGRDDASLAVATLAAAAGAWCVRVHAVRPAADAVRVAARWGAPVLSGPGEEGA